MKHSLLGCGVVLSSCGRYFYHTVDPLTIYATCGLLGMTGRFGMYSSTDGGDTYRLMFETSLMSKLAISQSNPRIMYGAGVAGSVLKSTDGGDSWSLVGQNDLIRKTRVQRGAAGTETTKRDADEWETKIYDIAIDPVDPALVYLVCTKGILRTEDGGESWCMLEAGIKEASAIRSIAMTPGRPSLLLAGTYKGLIRSADRGCHWESIDVLSRVAQ